MADRIYGAQTPASQDFDTSTHHFAMEFDVSSDASVVGGRVWVPSTGLADTCIWQLWRVSDETLLADCDVNTVGPGTPSTWLSFTSADFTTPGDVAIVTTDSYVVGIFSLDGDFVFTDNGTETFPVGVGIVSSSTGRENLDDPQNTFPATIIAAYFFADVEVEAEAGVTGTLALTLPAIEFDGAGELTVSGALDSVLPPVEMDSAGEVTVSGVLDPDLPELEADLSGEAISSGVLGIDLPAILSDIVGQAPVAGILTIELPTIQVDILGVSAAGGATVAPCGWEIPAPLCCPEWDTLDPAIQSSAQDYAATVLWAATGRQFGLCEISVRPCGMRRCQDGSAEFFGYDWSGGTWVPYIFDGAWFNCACPSICCCDPRCQIRLMGPVASIVEVTIGGIVVDPATYRVDDNHWLVRTGGECWPQCADMDTDDGTNVLVVTYQRGDAIPPSLLRAASTLACEWGKACTGADCRLSNRVTSLARNGINIQMFDPSDLLAMGWTGIPEVDTIIQAFNPYGLKQRMRIYAPELNVPRTVTSP